MIRILQLKLPVTHTDRELADKIAKELRIRKDQIEKYQIHRRSVDARKEPVCYVYQIDVWTQQEKRLLASGKNKNIVAGKEEVYRYPDVGDTKLSGRPVVIGSGPAGLFCAHALARQGFCPIVLERGDTAIERRKKVDTFWQDGTLDVNSNVQFGEGGAGTFSDGKLNTLVKDPALRGKEVLRLFVEAGAPSEILYEQKPHLGTDVLIDIIQTLRRQIEAWGGTFRFRAQVTDLKIEQGQIRAVEINHNEVLPCPLAVLAIGHSARDTFSLLHSHQITMQSKAFAVGVRIEHPQEMITANQYGIHAPKSLGAAPYKVTHKLADGRGVYSFCMCPGGYVVNASSEEGMLAVNGMSYQARDGKNANSAMVVTVTPEDYKAFHVPDTDPVLDGIAYQRALEKKAFRLADGKVPIQLFKDFAEKKESTALGDVAPAIKGAYDFARLDEVFPAAVYEALRDGITSCGRKIHGFDRADAILSGVESRTSSPIRILRDPSLESSLRGLYPCGEGAGYAGGITSAAMDGLHVAERIIQKYQPE